MKITFIRSGGFCGGKETLLDFSTENLEESTRKHIEAFVNASDFFNLPKLYDGKAGIMDGFYYRLIIVDGDKFNDIFERKCGMQVMPEGLRALWKELIQISREIRDTDRY